MVISRHIFMITFNHVHFLDSQLATSLLKDLRQLVLDFLLQLWKLVQLFRKMSGRGKWG